MLTDKERLFISDQFVRQEYCKDESVLRAKCNNQAFAFFTTSDNENVNNCGDHIAFAVKKDNEKIEEIFFSRQEACIIAVSATNILCKWIIEKKKNFKELATLLFNVRKMINGRKYELADCQEIGVFSNLKSFAVRKSCLLLVVNSFLQIIGE